VCSKGFKRSRYGSLHAYLPIGLAVETSQPQFLNKTTNLQKINLPFTINYQPKTTNQIWAYPSPGFPTARVGLSAAIFLSFTIGLQNTIPKRQKGFPLPSLTQLRKIHAS